MTARSTESTRSLSYFLTLLFVVACAAPTPSASNGANMFVGQTGQSQVARGRYLVIEHGCGDCHSTAVPSPLAEGWLAGLADTDSGFVVGPFRTRPRNLTPDNATGLGRFSERQIFNALRYGLRPGETPDVEITSNVPGEGNFPLHPKYLAPPMPWIAYRNMSDADLLAIVSYLRHGLKPVRHRVKDSDGPPDFWVGTYTVDKVGPYPAPAFPAATESAQR